MVRRNQHRVEAFKIKLADILVQYNYDQEEQIFLSTADECAWELISFTKVFVKFLTTFKACYGAHLVSYQTMHEIFQLAKFVGYCRIIWCHKNYKLSLPDQITPNSVSEYVVKYQKKEKTATKEVTSQKQMRKKSGKIVNKQKIAFAKCNVKCNKPSRKN